MSHAINALELVDRTAARLHDTTFRLFTRDIILAAADDLVRRLWGLIRSSGEAYGADWEVFTTSGATPVAQDIIELELPHYVGDIQRIEAINGDVTTPLVRAGYEDIGAATSRLNMRLPAWMFTKGTHLPVVQIRGSLGTSSLRIYFVRNFGPLHYGPASAGSTTTLTPGAVTAGVLKGAGGMYRNMELEIIADTAQASNIGHLTRITAHAAGVFTISPAAPAAISATTSYALLVPVPLDGQAYFLEQLAYDLHRRAGNADEVALLEGVVQQMQYDFLSTMRSRDTGEPRRLTNSRIRGG